MSARLANPIRHTHGNLARAFGQGYGDFRCEGPLDILAKRAKPFGFDWGAKTFEIVAKRANHFGFDLGAISFSMPSSTITYSASGLACSLTPEYEKVADDATKVRKNYPDVQVLVFATPGKVTKYKEKQWAENLSNDFGLDLVVMSREELVTSLLDPSNADVCRSQLGIHPEEKPELQSVFACVREAIGEVIDNWAQRPRLRGRPLVDLDAERIEGERDSPERLSVEDLRASLAQGRRIILEAPPAAEKRRRSSRSRSERLLMAG